MGYPPRHPRPHIDRTVLDRGSQKLDPSLRSRCGLRLERCKRFHGRRLRTLHIPSLLKCCGSRTVSNKTSNVYPAWSGTRGRRATNAVHLTIAHVVIGLCTKPFGGILTSAPGRFFDLLRVKLTAVKSTHTVGDEECVPRMIRPDGCVVEILTQTIRASCEVRKTPRTRVYHWVLNRWSPSQPNLIQ